ncbi:kinase-like domain-containing protein [Phaeosphaeria sp. MPI-PUGE-AT-0046c]|nr:kinase-like domain-containing protein [Phaeosphaeria sp. MPI-PUGE-AT-0046c]
MSDQEGLEWVNTTFGLEPRWTKEPDVDIIRNLARKHLGHDDEVQIDVTFYAQGAFNKLYKIQAAGSACLMRVALPVCPHLKTESEVATINFVRDHVDIPAPHILAYDSASHNDLGFEWILMELMPGDTLRKRWRKMSWNTKATVVKQLAQYQARLNSKPFLEIGNLFAPAEGSLSPAIGPMVSQVFFWGDRLTHNVPRGPFKSSLKWLQTRLDLAIADQERLLRMSENEDDIEDAEFAKALAGEVTEEPPQVFKHEVLKRTVLFHDDISMQNILVDDEGELTAVIDWECSDDQAQNAADALDNEGVNNLYWEHRLEYEQTQLRRTYTEEMATLIPYWTAAVESSTLQADFDKAVHNCDNPWAFKIVSRWLQAYKGGNIKSLSDKLLE